VATDAALAAAAPRWHTAPALALDTEFVRERTFYPRLGLVQICDGQATYLIDPLPLRAIEPLAAVLGDPRVLKVIHSASEDVEVLWRATRAVPSPLFDTQIAAGLAGMAPGLGYQKLVHAVLGVELAKGETRTDWLRRPLSAEQLRYAVDDVTCLFALYRDLRARLEGAERLAWALEDAAALLDTERFTPRPLEAYRRVKGTQRFDRRRFGALRLLAAWRDDEARRRDLPRSFVVKDEALVALATRAPGDAAELAKVSGLDARQIARDGEHWLALLAEAAALPEESLPPLPVQPVATAAGRALEKALREIARARAGQLGVVPEILVTRRPLEELVRSTLLDRRPTLPGDLTGWRREVVGEALLERAARELR
jgi:ribonuclease D